MVVAECKKAEPDLVSVDEAGRVALAKSASTPDDPSRGIMEGLGLLAGEVGRDLPGLLAETDRLVHGTTVATNALVERKGARVGVLTTAGHRDILEMREGLKEDRYNLRMPPPVPLVPRVLRLGVRERIRSNGTVAVPLNRPSLDAAIRVLVREEVEAVAVCLIHSYGIPATSSRPAGPWPGASPARTSAPRSRCSLRSRNTNGSARPW